ncbi:hypothetical protein B7C51_25170 (plasmid) [Paenibacillus larvae subsp. pulvifaciens]|uniref:Uncharacterized protein n=1 Tax=Paenibacillus larvae subsp. pulvifaciens TaxID=1477 RepID=A0A1V0UZZ5_9BACL|nr:hypothetical protein [Paenibacillus larvae]ARF70764.1 hypothetical protein B7C51_25170 [Paenibacillus larvae subsp. pulvifaciens]
MVEHKTSDNKITVPLTYAEINKLILKDLNKYKNKRYIKRFNKYKRDDIIRFMSDPAQYEEQLREVSNILYVISPHYKRLVQYFSKMGLYSYDVELTNIDFDKYNPKKIKKQYFGILQYLEKMNISHEFSKIMKVAYREDVFYGYEHETSTSYFIQKLNPKYCQISSIEDGCYNFSFDFSYFNSEKEKLNMYPVEFKRKYNIYKKDNTKQWQELDNKKTICFKVNEDVDFLIPPFAGVFESVYDIQDFKDLRKDKEEINNYKVLIQKIPLRSEKEVNDFAIDFNSVTLFHNRAVEALPEQVGLISTPMDVKEVDFDRASVDKDNVEKATRDYWSGTGVSQLLFNTDKSSSIGLEKSVLTDEEIFFDSLRQLERWLNRKMKYKYSKNLFCKINLLDITIFNKTEYFDTALKAAQSGVGSKLKIGAALKMSPLAMINMAILENKILKLPDILIPMRTSHTMTDPTGKIGGNGRPKEKDISDEGLKARDQQKGKYG